MKRCRVSLRPALKWTALWIVMSGAIARPAAAQPEWRSIELTNGTDRVLSAVHLSPRDRRGWGPNRMVEPLQSGQIQRLSVEVNPAAGQCYYDLAAQSDSGAPIEAYDLNFCELDRYTVQRSPR